MLTEKCAPPFCQFGGGVPNQKSLSIFRDLLILLRIVTHLSKTGGGLLYYHLYYEEA